MHLELLTCEPETASRPNPLLFVHGAWHSSWCWGEYFLPYFARQGYTAHALDLRGHGKSEGARRLRRNRLMDYVADVEQIARQFDQPPILIGHSMGGLIVQKYLETHQVPAAALLASVPPTGALRTTLQIAIHHPLPFLKANATLRLYPIVGTLPLAQEAFFSTQMAQEQVQTYFARIQDESYLAFLDMMLFSLPHPKRVQSPVLVLGGVHDTIFNRKEVEATARAYHTQATFFPVAHDMMLEDKWQDVADHILEWLHARNL